MLTDVLFALLGSTVARLIIDALYDLSDIIGSDALDMLFERLLS